MTETRRWAMLSCPTPASRTAAAQVPETTAQTPVALAPRGRGSQATLVRAAAAPMAGPRTPTRWLQTQGHQTVAGGTPNLSTPARRCRLARRPRKRSAWAATRAASTLRAGSVQLVAASIHTSTWPARAAPTATTAASSTRTPMVCPSCMRAGSRRRGTFVRSALRGETYPPGARALASKHRARARNARASVIPRAVRPTAATTAAVRTRLCGTAPERRRTAPFLERTTATLRSRKTNAGPVLATKRARASHARATRTAAEGTACAATRRARFTSAARRRAPVSSMLAATGTATASSPAATRTTRRRAPQRSATVRASVCKRWLRRVRARSNAAAAIASTACAARAAAPGRASAVTRSGKKASASLTAACAAGAAARAL